MSAAIIAVISAIVPLIIAVTGLIAAIKAHNRITDHIENVAHSAETTDQGTNPTIQP